MNPINLPDSPLVQPFLEALADDDDRAALEADVRACLSVLSSLQERAIEINTRIAQIGAEFGEATGRRREALLTERAALVSECEMMPDVAEQAAKGYAAALIRWARTVRQHAIHEHNAAFDERTPLAAAARDADKRYAKFSGCETTFELDAEKARAARADQQVITEKIRPLNERRDRARNAVDGIDLGITQLFGDEYDGHSRATISIDGNRRDRWVRSFVADIKQAAV